jgi:Fic family protein
MTFDPTKPYNDLPLLTPKADIETRSILKKTITAGRALAELKGVGETIPNQAILVDSLVLQEAKASSEIENIITTNDALFQALAAKTSQVDPAVKEVLYYRGALWEGLALLKERNLLTTNLFIKVYQTIKQNTAGIRSTPGTRIADVTTGVPLYTPPEGEQLIRQKLKNLEEYIHDPNTIDPLVKLAVIHYQFESIHPFTDGNGRTGRILNTLYLVHRGLIDLPVIYLSKYIIDNKANYYRLLRQVTETVEWEPWILYMLDAVEQTALLTRRRVVEIRDLLEQTVAIAKDKLPSRVYSKELVELLFHQPYIKGETLVRAGIAQRKTAASYLAEFERIGILRRQKAGKENLYLNIRLFELLAR